MRVAIYLRTSTLTSAPQSDWNEESTREEEDRSELVEADAAHVHACNDAADVESGRGDEGQGEDCGEWRLRMGFNVNFS